MAGAEKYDRHRASFRRQAERRPRVPRSREPHVRPLDLLSRPLPLDVQIQSDQRKRHLDRLAVLVGVLRGEGVDDVLMNERRVAEGQGIGAQRDEGVLL